MAERTRQLRTTRRRQAPRPRSSQGAFSTARRMPLLVAASVLVVVGIALVALAVKSSGRPTSVPAAGQARRQAPMAAAAAGTVEVPAVAGARLADAQLMLDAAGFKLSISFEAQAAGQPGTVLGQDPAPGVLVPAGTTIRLVISGNNAGTSSPPATTAAATAPKSPQFVVVIDPGHQAHSDQSLEPIGPGCRVKKAKSTGGTTGIDTHISEYEIVLQVSTNLAVRLRDAGIKVVMTRTTNDVNLSNAQRAAIANRVKADLFVRVHGNGSPDPRLAGVSTLYPAPNQWGRRYSSAGKQAALLIQRSLVDTTRAPDRGVEPRGDLAGFNYARVPSVLVECGYLSNPVEDRLLASPHYQDKVAQGIADGVMAYLKRVR